MHACCDVVNRGVAVYEGKYMSVLWMVGWSRWKQTAVKSCGLPVPSKQRAPNHYRCA